MTTPFYYSLYAERALGLTIYLVYLHRNRAVAKSPWWWARLTSRSAHAKGAREVARAEKRWHW